MISPEFMKGIEEAGEQVIGMFSRRGTAKGQFRWNGLPSGLKSLLKLTIEKLLG
jgi:hypothetical protein